MHWSDGLKTEEDLRQVLRGMSKNGVLQDGARVRVSSLMMDNAPAKGAKPSWQDCETPQFVTDTAGMSLRDVATAVARHPMPLHIPDSQLKQEALRCRFGDGVSDLSADEVAASFITLVATGAGDIARYKSIQATRDAWRSA